MLVDRTIAARPLAASLVALLLLANTVVADTDIDLPPGAEPATIELAPPEFEGSDEVGKLIQALGSSRYVTRREAEQKLLEFGMKAFDQIDASTSNADPEIAASCRYLVSELTVRWTRRDDVPQVKAELTGYANLDEDERIAVVYRLAQQKKTWAVSPLCRICRYDPSPAVSRQAAIALMATSDFELDYNSEIADQMRAEIGSSVRRTATWVRLLAGQIEHPRAALNEWPAEIERAVATAAADMDDEVYLGQLCELLTNYARVALECNDTESFLAAVEQYLEYTTESKVAAIEHFVEWSGESGNKSLVNQLMDRHREVLSQSKVGLYLMAKTYAEQDNSELAEQLADQALNLRGENNTESAPEMRVIIGSALLREGYVEWGRRELRKTIEEGPVASVTHAQAAYLLSDSLHDWQQNQEASDVLLSFTEPIQNDTNLRNAYENRAKSASRMGSSMLIPPTKKLESYQQFYLACALHEQGDVDAEWEALKNALKADDDNIDIIIAMYRVAPDGTERRAEVMEIIQQRLRMLDQMINDYSGTSSVTSNWYNEWAWLVSNTEGDFQKAVRYSHKSIEMETQEIEQDPDRSIDGTAGLLDTLGRCYYAAGDIDNAIKYQSQAVEYRPHMRTLKRQLDEFRQAKSGQQG
ncbi:hypothetical protein [Aeoliella mucimassa]|uniref:Tetratricopeptide repeat protein n=1 Tax=Aeoliella mucimassa TaxID=2527972 RepID=A0A518AJG7_9BACT|nr:hypothetical protein [Aeoliella mucimassa]QDU54865.1 Tetratricopeptide repeat protein [Aeoliella mucimassa]